MRIVIPVLIIILGFALSASAAGKVCITLTTDQVNLVNAAGAGGATISLSTEQKNAVKQTFPNLAKSTILVAPTTMNSKKQICISCDSAGNPSASAP
jgi:hypothetical protein